MKKKPILKKPKKKTVKNRLDKKWSLKVREVGECAINNKDCSQQLHPHHIIGRRNTDTRWDLKNGICLCAIHHTLGKQSAHEDPLWFKEWLDENEPERMEYLNKKRKEPLHGTYSVEDYLKIEEETFDC